MKLEFNTLKYGFFFFFIRGSLGVVVAAPILFTISFFAVISSFLCYIKPVLKDPRVFLADAYGPAEAGKR